MRTTFMLTIAAAGCLAHGDVEPMLLHEFPGDTAFRAEPPPDSMFIPAPRDPFDDGGVTDRGIVVTPSDIQLLDMRGLDRRGQVLPAPGGVVLLGTGALLAGRRRR